jgi:SAM-dependent methyltransferase
MSDAPKAQTRAGGYEGRIGRYGGALADAFVDAVGVRPDWRVLDVGCGTGALTERLAAAVGAERVAGIDPGADDIAACAERSMPPVPPASTRPRRTRTRRVRSWRRYGSPQSERLWQRLGRPAGGFRLEARAWYAAGRVRGGLR